MNILFASSEVTPFSKTGGLADVAGALPIDIALEGHKVLVVSPRYRTLRQPVKPIGKKISFQLGNRKESGELFGAALPAAQSGANVPVIFVGNDNYFNRDELYNTPDGDYPDNDLRFSFFGRALLEAARAVGFKPDIVHLNDWQSAIAAVYLRTKMSGDTFFNKARILLTIHNLGYQGIFAPETVAKAGLPPSVFNMEMLEFYGKVNFLKGGIVFADAVNTVSRRYASEIQTAEHGMGLEGILKKRSDWLFGILNGVNYADWDPERDKFIAANYSAKDLSAKKTCKKDLLAQFGLPYVSGTAVVGMISRLDNQKGFDLLEESLPDIMIRNAQLVILGTGLKRFHDFFETVKDRYRGRLGVKLAYDNAIAHKIEAGSDIFLMPSRYEPCGLNQMYSLKYGTVPVVRATGGLDDTIFEWDGYGKGNGFKFYDYDSRKMLECLDRALKTYLDKRAWSKIIANGMAEDHSWRSSARRYIDLYKKMLE